jgi:hypothetical protein
MYGQPTTVTFTVVDGCGPWNTFTRCGTAARDAVGPKAHVRVKMGMLWARLMRSIGGPCIIHCGYAPVSSSPRSRRSRRHAEPPRRDLQGRTSRRIAYRAGTSSGAPASRGLKVMAMMNAPTPMIQEPTKSQL